MGGISEMAVVLIMGIFFVFVFQEGGGEPPHGKLGWAIDEDFGSFDKLVKKMNAEGAALQGSGWVVCTFCATLSGLCDLC
jgi:superoxide dismutase